MAPKLILTGFMATGKSAVARAIARRLSWRLIDCDQRLAAQSGKFIAEVFRAHGESHFRDLECAIIQEIADEDRRCPQCTNPLPAVIATGGGALPHPPHFRPAPPPRALIFHPPRPPQPPARAAGHAGRRQAAQRTHHRAFSLTHCGKCETFQRFHESPPLPPLATGDAWRTAPTPPS